MGTLELQGSQGCSGGGEGREAPPVLLHFQRDSTESAQLLLALGGFSTLLVTNRAGAALGTGEGREGDPTCVLVSCHALPCQGVPGWGCQLCQPILIHEVQPEGQMGPSTAKLRANNSIFHLTHSTLGTPGAVKLLANILVGGHSSDREGSATAMLPWNKPFSAGMLR